MSENSSGYSYPLVREPHFFCVQHLLTALLVCFRFEGPCCNQLQSSHNDKRAWHGDRTLNWGIF